MPSYNALLPQDQADNSDSRDDLDYEYYLSPVLPTKPDFGNSFVLKLGLITSIATTSAICMPNSSSAAYAADLKAQDAAESNLFASPKTIPKKNNIPSIFLPRTFNLIIPNLTTTPILDPASPYQQAENQNLFIKTSIRTNTNINPNSNIYPSSSAPNEPNLKIHQVKLGDTVNQIARKYQVPLNELVKINKLENSNLISVNQKLIIPATAPGSTPSKPAATVLAGSIAALNQQKYSVDGSPTEDPYIAKLRMELEQMRAAQKPTKQIKQIGATAENLNKPKALKADLSPSNVRKNAYLALDTASKENSGEVQKIATSIPARPNTESNLFDKEVISLRLPPLRPSEEYLPSGFDGYSWPAQGVLTSGYGWRWGRLHAGIDIAAPIGTPVVAAASGEVIKAEWDSGGYGNLIELQHLDGSVTVYGHNDEILVNVGQQVKQGEQIAKMGSTGNSTGSHSHFEIRPDGQETVDPSAFLSR